MYHKYPLGNYENAPWTVGCDLCKMAVKVIEGGPKNGQYWCGCRYWGKGELREARNELERRPDEPAGDDESPGEDDEVSPDSDGSPA